jgi:dCMP deaminase
MSNLVQSDLSWDLFYLSLAAATRRKSKDPSTKVGSILVRPNNTVASLGFNGIPSRIPDSADILNNRELKYLYIQHAEINCLNFCNDATLVGYTLYVYPLKPCPACTLQLISKGISKVVMVDKPSLQPIWDESWKLSKQMLEASGVEIKLVSEEDYIASL